MSNGKNQSPCVYVCTVIYLSNKSDSEAAEKGKRRGRQKKETESAGRNSRVEHLTNKQFFWMCFAVVSDEKTECLLVPYDRSSEADGDVQKKRGQTYRGQVIELVIVRTSGRRRAVDAQSDLKAQLHACSKL